MSTDNKITVRGLSVWFVCALFFMYEFLLRTVLGSFQYPLMQDLHLSPFSFAILSSTSFQVIYGIMQIPVGIITDKLGLKKTLITAAVICSLSTLAFSFAHSLLLAVPCRVFMGLGAAFGFVCLLVAVYDWMPKKNIGFFIGISQFIGTIGPMFAAGPLSSLANDQAVSWRYIFGALSLIGVILVVLITLIVDKNRQSKGKFVILSKNSTIKDNIFKIIRNPQSWLIGLYSSTIYFSIEYFSENEGIHFLIKKGFSGNFSAYMLTLSWFGYAISCPLMGFLSDLFQRRKLVMCWAGLILILALTTIIYGNFGQVVTAIAFVSLGIGAGGQSVGFATMAEQNKSDYLAQALGFNNALIMVVAAINAPVLGILLGKYGASISLTEYRYVFSVIISISLIPIIVATFFIKETFCKPMLENTVLSIK